MLNIFNLFLFLFALWIMFMISAGNVSWLYLILGFSSAALVSFASYKLKLIEEKSELLYLSLGFYRHFLKIYFENIFSAFNLIIDLALNKETAKAVIHKIPLDHSHKYNLALLATTVNMTTGLFCIGMSDYEIIVHAIDEEHFKKLNLQKTARVLLQINDDNLV